MKKLGLSVLHLALLAIGSTLASCDDAASSDPRSPSPSLEARLPGHWTWAYIDLSWVDIRPQGKGMVYTRGMNLDDSIPFTWSISGDQLKTTMDGKDYTGRARMFGSDSLALEHPGLGTGLLFRSETRPW